MKINCPYTLYDKECSVRGELAAAYAEVERLRALCAALCAARPNITIAQSQMDAMSLLSWISQIDAAGRGEGEK
jgi:hypothetical protein